MSSRLTHTLSEHRPASNWSLLTLCEDTDLGHAEGDDLDDAWQTWVDFGAVW
jgi:hypothetical protein